MEGNGTPGGGRKRTAESLFGEALVGGLTGTTRDIADVALTLGLPLRNLSAVAERAGTVLATLLHPLSENSVDRLDGGLNARRMTAALDESPPGKRPPVRLAAAESVIDRSRQLHAEGLDGPKTT